MGLDFRVLGPVEVLNGGRKIELGPRRQRTVLARLLVDAGRPVSVDRLLHDVWGGEPPPGALRTLRSYLSRLRAALGSEDALVVRRAPGYSLELRASSIDATHFEHLVAEGRDLMRRANARAAAARLRKALALWRGAPFADLPDEPFVVAEATRLEALRAAAVEDRMEADLVLGRHAELVVELEALLDKDPLRERLWAQLMTALYRVGRQADALAAYQRARAVLGEELGLEPGPELRRLETAILRHEVAASNPEPAHNLPTPLTAFVGRQREVADVLALVERARLVTLAGVGGGGKTRIAIQVGSRLTPRFPDGVWMVDLAPLSDSALIAQTVAAAIGIEERTGRRGPAVLADYLAKAHTLVVLDNCEHLAASCAELVEQLLEAAPRLRVLATSREPLAVPGETVFEVPPMTAPPAGEEADLEDFDAVRLFVERSATPVGNQSLPTVAHICRELDGIPLAIEIAAAQTKLLSPEEIAARLSDRFRLLSYWSRTALPRHRTLRASIDWSYALLDIDGRVVFHHLAVFAGGFTLAAAEAVVTAASGGGHAASAETPAAEVTPGTAAPAQRTTLDVLRRLVDASLVQRSPGGDAARFGLLETVRQYALDRAVEAGDAGEARRRHAEFYADVAEEARRSAGTPEEPRRYADLDAEHANVRAALEWAFSVGDGALLARLARGMGNYWRLRGYVDEGEVWLRRAIDVGGDVGPEVGADLRGFLGHIHLRRNDFHAARQRLEDAVALARRGDNTRQLRGWLHQLAFSFRGQGDFARSKEVLAEAIAVARQAGDRMGVAHGIGGLADIAVHERRWDDAERLFGEVWELVQPPTPAALVHFLESTARLALERGDLDDGARRAEEGLAHARHVGDRWHVGLNLVSLAYVARRRGDPTCAGDLLVEALDALWPLREIAGVAEAFDILGGILLDTVGPGRAAAVFGAADGLRTRFGIPLDTFERAFVSADRTATRARLGDVTYEELRVAGASMELDDVLSMAGRTRSG